MPVEPPERPVEMFLMDNQQDRRIYGVDWSGGLDAGKKTWIATLDPSAGVVRDVGRPFPEAGPEKVVTGLASWLLEQQYAWVGFDFPFGIGCLERTQLFGEVADHPSAWAQALRGRFPSFSSFLDRVTQAGLVGKGRRLTDQETRAPFSPLLLQLIRQTYWGHRLLCQLNDSRVRLLPWDWQRSSADINLLEICPATFLFCSGLDNRGYKGKSEENREQRAYLLDAVLTQYGWSLSHTKIRDLVIEDREGDALDAILAALATWKAASYDNAYHQRLLQNRQYRQEGFIYR